MVPISGGSQDEVTTVYCAYLRVRSSFARCRLLVSHKETPISYIKMLMVPQEYPLILLGPALFSTGMVSLLEDAYRGEANVFDI